MVFGAGGSLASPIPIIADDNTTKDAIEFHKVVGLGIGMEPNPVGYVVFCNTRTFYEWLMNVVIIPYINKIKLYKGLDENSLSWLTLDGESKQIIPMIKEYVQLGLKNNNIVVTKPPESTSHVAQPVDVGTIFKVIKSTLRGLRDEDNTNNHLRENILESITNHEINVGKEMNPSH